MYLVFDTETTGLPINWNAPISNVDNWPRLVQLAWMNFDLSGKEISRKNYIIKPDNFFIPHDSAKVHGISTERALLEGIEIESALNEFISDLKQAKILIAHNISFDHKIVGAEMFRKNIKSNLDSIEKIDTMERSVDFCKIPGKDKYKYPKLSELYFKLFNSSFEDAHNALVDVMACAKCFFELQKLGIIPKHDTIEEKISLSPQQISLF